MYGLDVRVDAPLGLFVNTVLGLLGRDYVMVGVRCRGLLRMQEVLLVRLMQA